MAELSMCHEVCPWGWEDLWRGQGTTDRIGIFSMSSLWLLGGREPQREAGGGQEASRKRKPLWAVKVKTLERALRH